MMAPNEPTLFANSLLAYCDSQEASAGLARLTHQPHAPWPATDNPMLRYLIASTLTLVEAENLHSALLWLATHAWFEGGLEAISRSAPPTNE
jgi:hypothetical protein